MSLIAPSVLPARAFQRIDRVSRCLFHWRAADFSLWPITGQTPSFTRASAGGATVDSVGKLITPVHSQPRFTMVDLDGDGVREAPSLLLEASSTNLVAPSDGFAGWTLVNATVDSTSESDPFRTKLGSIVNASQSNGSVRKPISFTGNGTKSISMVVKQGTAMAFGFSIHDVSASTTRHRVDVTWTGGIPVLTTQSGSGMLFPPERLADGWWRVGASVDNVVAANSHQFILYASAGAAGTTLAMSAQTEDRPTPSSCVRTGSSTVARSSDALSWQFLALPQEMSIYLRFIESGGVIQDGTTRILLHLGSGSSPRFFVSRGSSSSVYSMTYNSMSVSAIAPSIAPGYGDISEILCTLPASGRARMLQSVNGGPPHISIATADVPMPATPWSSPILHLNALGGSNPSLTRYLDLKLAAGVRTLQEMREIL